MTLLLVVKLWFQLVTVLQKSAHITTYKFEGDSYSHTTLGITTSGKFAVEDNKIYFWGENETREDANGTSFNKGSDNEGSYVEIGGIRYYKD